MKSCYMTAIIVSLLIVAAAAAAVPGRGLDDGYVGCSTSDNGFAFDLSTYATGNPIDLLPEGNYPYDATMTPDGSEVWIPGASGDGVVVIDRATDTIVARIGVDDYPVSVAFTSDGSLALVATRGGENLNLIDTTTYTVTGTLPIPTSYLGAGNIALDPITGMFYLVDWYGDELYEIAPDGSEILRQIDLGDSLWQLVVSPDGMYVYVTDRGDDLIHVLDRATLTTVTTYPVGDDPWGIDVTEDGAYLVVTCEDSHEAYVIATVDGATTPIALDSSADPRDVDILDVEGLAFVVGGAVSGGINPVYVIDIATATIVDSFEGPGSNTNVIAVQPQMHDSPVAVGDDDARQPDLIGPAQLALHPNYPNPFNPETTIAFELPVRSNVELAVYDLQGREVAVLLDGTLDAGRHSQVWNGRDASGRLVASGVYYYQLRSEEQNLIRKMSLVK